jgi:hypothetical protein
VPLAVVLGISEFFLYHRAGRMPRELRDVHADD